MSAEILNRLRDRLNEQRENIEDWLEQTPEEEKQVRLGPFTESAVEEHLHVLKSAVTNAEQETLGICKVCHDAVEPRRLEVDYTACVCLEHYTDEQRRALEKELELSQKVQKALLPHAIPEIPGLEIAAFSQPARIVGGDYFDFFEYKDRAPGLIIADVMGKGIAASLLMASLQASLRILVTQENDLCEIVRRVDQLFLHNINLTKFVTLVLVRFDLPSHTMSYCNAGHNPPLILSHSRVSWLQPTTPAIGLVENSRYESKQVRVSPGDLLLLYTDGVTEARNPREEEFGSERLVIVVEESAGISAKQTVASLRRAILEFGEGEALHDDTTVVALRLDM